MKIRRMTTIGMMVCLMTICSWITIPSAVPFTMQTFAVFCCVLLLGPADAALTLVTYMLLGCTGLPVFSGFQGGIGHIAGPTGGFIVGFFIIPTVYRCFLQPVSENSRLKFPVLFSGLLLCYFAGSLWFYELYGSRSFLSVLTICVLPYIIPDILKLLFAIWLCTRLKKTGIIC